MVMLPEGRRAEAALWRAAKAEGRAPASMLSGLNTYNDSSMKSESIEVP